MVLGRSSLAKYCTIASANAAPSAPEVPRPTSSIITKLFLLALFKIVAVSSISTIKVERPEARSSEAPILVKMRSISPMIASLAGTNEPMRAMIAIKAVWRIKVDLPPMLGPEITARLRLSLNSTPLEMNGVLFKYSTTG